MKKVLLLIFMLCSVRSFADTSGDGCFMGQDVYTQYLGTNPAQPGVKFYKSTGPSIPIYWGWGCNDCRGYRCGYINVYGSGTYWDPDLGRNIPIEAQQEYTTPGGQCIIAPSVNSDQSNWRWGSYAKYSYNKTDLCNGGTPQNVPLDDHSWLLVLISSAGAVFFLRRSILN